MIDLELYRIFFVVAEVKNITKASEKLNISQPAVTKHIKNLEEQLGSPLFIRTKKGVVLSEYGNKIFLKVKQALTLMDEVEKEISQYKALNIGTIKIGISTTLAREYLLTYIEKFHSLYPNIIIDIYTDPTKDLIQKLKKGEIDFIISKFPKIKDLDLSYEILGTTRYIFVANNQYSSLFYQPVPIEKLKDYPILLQRYPSNSRNSVEEYLKDNHVSIEPKMSIASSSLLIDFVEMGYGIGYVTELYVEDLLKKKKLFLVDVIPKTNSVDYGIILLKNNIYASYCQKFIRFLRENRK